MGWRIPLADVDFTDEEFHAVQKVLESRWLTMGGTTRQFESDFADFVGAKEAIAVTNCTAGLHLAYAGVGIGPGDEVIVPSLTFVATANAVFYTGATPVFADITSESDLTISPQAIENCITEKTKAIVVMHYGGYACDLPEILKIAKKHKLAVIEDAAHAVGAKLDEKDLGTWGDIGCYSFFPNKNMTTAEGGMVVTNDEKLAERMRRLRSHGMTSMTWDRHRGHAWSYDVVELGYNYRIDEIRSALGIAQLKKLPKNNGFRRELTTYYHSLLNELTPEIRIPFEHHRGHSSCHIMPVLLPNDIQRAPFMDEMKKRGIQTSIHYPPSHMFSFYQEEFGSQYSLPNTENVAKKEVTLPLYPGLKKSEIEYVVQSVKESLGAIKEKNKNNVI